MGRSKGDVESGYNVSHGSNNNNNNNNNRDQLYPTMIENPQLRWAFIRKVYILISMQLLLTVAVAAAVVFYRPIPNFFVRTTAGLIAYIAIIISTFLRT
ncbi:hypothetical protein TIFTF001_015953 [Ficus carica]|uniref:Uncharacterized protein n=1 Tax=Ficus carica TaxID=3494 RepID=A0AA88D9F7_FICCA|nr:hypothetical protein TIFTF001_015953 [Ficus carica]